METNFENVFNSIFNSLEILSKNWNANYKKVSNNALYKNNQIIYSIDFSNYKLSWIKYEILIYNNLLNEININSKNILIIKTMHDLLRRTRKSIMKLSILMLIVD